MSWVKNVLMSVATLTRITWTCCPFNIENTIFLKYSFEGIHIFYFVKSFISVVYSRHVLDIFLASTGKKYDQILCLYFMHIYCALSSEFLFCHVSWKPSDSINSAFRSYVIVSHWLSINTVHLCTYHNFIVVIWLQYILSGMVWRAVFTQVCL